MKKHGVRAQKAEVAATYNSTIARVKRWIRASAMIAPFSLAAWIWAVPKLPHAIRLEGEFVAAVSLGLSVYIVIVGFILWAILAHERRKDLQD